MGDHKEQVPSGDDELALFADLFVVPWYVPKQEGLRRWWYSRRVIAEPGLIARVYALTQIPDLPRESVAELARAKLALARLPGSATAYDTVWSAVHQIRHQLCLRGRTEDLVMLGPDIRADFEYNSQQSERHKELDGLFEELSTCTQGMAPRSLAHKFANLSKRAAEQRESTWRKVNRVIVRRRRASATLVVLALFLIVLLPQYVEGGASSAQWCSEAGGGWCCGVAWYALVAFCGAIGGLLSGLVKRDAIDLSSKLHRLEQLAFELRPRIGAVSALLLVLMVHAGLLGSTLAQIANESSEAPAGDEVGLEVEEGATEDEGRDDGESDTTGDDDPIPSSPAIILLIAMLGGFSERIFLGRVEHAQSMLDFVNR